MMQRKLIVAALTAAFTLPVSAFADNGNFTFYGAADVSYDSITTGDGTVTANNAPCAAPCVAGPVTGVNKRVVSSNVSKFGFKGSEDLGDGLSAIWQVEQQIDLDNASKATFASRNTFAGLKNETMGTLLFGIHDTPYKLSTRKLDVFGDSIADNRALIGAPKSATAVAANSGNTGTSAFAGASSQGFELRPTNVLAYFSPSFSGFSVAVAMVNLKEQNYVSTDKEDSVTSLSATYDAAPFYVSIAQETHKLDSANGKESASRVGFGFKPEGFELGAVYETTSDDLGTAGENKYGHTAYYVSGKMILGNDAIKLAYGKAGVMGSGVNEILNSDASQISIGYDHGLSKRTKVYAIYSSIKNGKGINYGFSQSTAASSSNSGFGTSPSVVSLGVKHSF